MASKGKLHLLLSVLFLVIILSTTTISVQARKHHVGMTKPHKHPKHKSRNDGPGGSDVTDPATSPSRIFDVLSFGAKGDGVSDDTKALQGAWQAACRIEGATVEIPSDSKFLIRPITLQGPCRPCLVLQIDGTILAPTDVNSWPESSFLQWINIKWIHNFTIQGSGTVDGQGSNWWHTSQIYDVQKNYKHTPKYKPTALRFYSSFNVTVYNIKIVDSPNCHLKFDNSGNVKVNNITISSPEDSPNTDGIHLQNSKDVEIQHSNISCGDDCVSIQTGCSNVHVHHINCGPGHGISIGALGKDQTIACVSNIVVDNISVQNTPSGVRIKTWQGGMGSVKNISFKNIQVSDVEVPIVIDQFYGDKSFRKNSTRAVQIFGIKYSQINGTYLVRPINLACSIATPCTDINLNGIQLKPSPRYRRFGTSFCSNSYGKSEGPLVPSSIDYCLRSSRNSVKRIARSHVNNVCY